MSNFHHQLKIREWIIIIGVCFAAYAGLLQVSINKIALYIVLPFLFILSFATHKSLFTNKYMTILTALFAWVLFSVFWATSLPHALVQVNQILGSFLLCYIFSVQGKNTRMLPWLYLSFIILLIGDWSYANNNMLEVIDLGVDRLDDAKLNANTFGYHTFYATFAAFIIGELQVPGKKIFRILFLFMIPLSFVTSILTASRQVLIIQIPLIALLLYGRYFKSKPAHVKVVTVSLLAIAIIISSPRVIDIYNSSTLKERNELDLKEDGRMLLLQDALRVGNEHFPLGVGANNFVVYSYNKGFSHNTYLELYVNEGILGLVLYLYLMWLFIKTQWRRYRVSGDIMFFYFFVAGVIFAFDGFFYVFYPHLWLISFFILVATHSETYFKNYKLSV